MDTQEIKQLIQEKYLAREKKEGNQTISSSEAEELMSFISELLSANSDNEKQFKFIQQYANEKSANLHDLINNAATFLDRSIVVIDLSFRLMDHSSSVAVTDPLWIRNIANGYCSYKFMSTVKDLLPDEDEVTDNKAFPVNCDYSTENKLCCRLVYKGKSIGYLALIDNNKGILPYHYEYLPKISTLVVHLLVNTSKYQHLFNSFGSNIYSGLLLHPEKSEQLIRQYRQSHPESLPKRCIEIRSNSHSIIDLTYLQRLMESMFPSGIFFIYKEILVGIVPDTEIGNMPDETSGFFNNVRETGISSIFEKPEDFPQQFANAQAACRLAARTRNKGKIQNYDDYVFFDLLDHISDTDVLKAYMHPLLKVLHEYDLVHDTSLLSTLELYLQNGQNAKLTAEKMFIHRNTLNYRLSKIHELAGTESWTPAELFRLECSFKINRLLHIT